MAMAAQRDCRWHTRGHGVCFQPVSAYPEPGLMTWNDDGTVMRARRAAPTSRNGDSLQAVVSRCPRPAHVYRAGNIAVLVRDRTTRIPAQARLADLLDEFADDRTTINGLLDCEFSIAERLEVSMASGR